MRILTAMMLYFMIAIALLHGAVWLGGIGIVWFSVRYGAGWLLPLAFCVDGYFGYFYHVPYISLGAIWWYAVVVYIRPKIAHMRIMETYESVT